MNASLAEREAESWAFALAIYAKPGVAEACLTLQNEAGIDVMLLLMTTFAAVKHRTLLTRDEIKALDDASRPWREQIVQRLRSVRIELKTGPQPAPNEATETFRSKIKALELEAERFENQILAEHLPLRPPAQQRPGTEQLRTVLNDVVAHFAETTPNRSLSASIDTIVSAGMQDAS
jgi:uncharacterized protein (TIGR02444 family)